MRTYSFFIRLFISVALLIIFPVIIISGISNRELLSSSKNAIGNSCVDNLNTASKGISQLRDSLNKDCVNLSLNTFVRSIGNSNDSQEFFHGSRVTDSLQILNVLTKMVQADNNYYSVYIYLDNLNCTFTSDTGLVANDQLKDTEWLEYYNKYKNEHTSISFTNTRLLDEDNNISTTGKVYVTTYIYPLTGYTSSINGAIVVNIKESAINKMISSNTKSNNSFSTIINGIGQVISSGDRNLLSKDISKQNYITDVLNTNENSGYFFSTIDGTQYLISYFRSNFNDWIYVGADPLDSLMKGQRAFNNSIVLISVIVMLLSVLVAFIVSRKLYKPLNTMVKTIKSSNQIGFKENDDEISIITKALNSKNSDSRRPILENCIIKMLGDDPLDEESRDKLSEIFCFDNFTSIIISVDQYNSTSKEYEEKNWGFIKSLMIELSEKILSRYFKCLGSSVKKGEVTIFCNTENLDEDTVQRIKECSAEIQNEINKAMENSITIGIGGIHEDMTTGIIKSYREAQLATKQKLKTGLGKIIVWDDEFAQSAYYYPVDIEEQIRTYLDFNKKGELTSKIEKLIENLKNRKNLSCDNIIQIITQLAGNTIIKYMIENHINVDDVYGINFNIYSEISQIETLDELKLFLLEKYSFLLEHLTVEKEGKKTVDHIMEYISNNYKNDIGVNDISQYIGLSYSHVRKVFKEETGINILDYINSIRIEEAKNILLSKEDSIKNIAIAVGYNNDQSFERYFKKIVGITPGEFRSRKLAEIKNIEVQ